MDSRMRPKLNSVLMNIAFQFMSWVLRSRWTWRMCVFLKLSDLFSFYSRRTRGLKIKRADGREQEAQFLQGIQATGFEPHMCIFCFQIHACVKSNACGGKGVNIFQKVFRLGQASKHSRKCWYVLSFYVWLLIFRSLIIMTKGISSCVWRYKRHVTLAPREVIVIIIRLQFPAFSYVPTRSSIEWHGREAYWNKIYPVPLFL